MSDLDWAIGSNDLSWMTSDEMIERSKDFGSPRSHARRAAKRSLISAMKHEIATDIMPRLPESGESFHIVGNGRFDYWSLVPVVCGLLATQGIIFYGSTWTLNRDNATELFDLLDRGVLAEATMLTGIFFKRRESSIYAYLLDGLLKRGQRYVAFENHAKVTLLATPTHAITIEGSANFTANPRVEQYVITNDRALHDFHKDWMESMLAKGDSWHGK